MLRGAVFVALLLAVAAAAPAHALPAFQPDVFLQQKGDEYFAGRDLYSPDAVGESRSLIIRDRLVLVVKVQNAGSGACSYSVKASDAAPGYTVRYRVGRHDVTTEVLAGTFTFDHLKPHQTRTLTAAVSVAPDAPLGAQQSILVTARSTTEPDQVDAARADILKVSEPGSSV